MASGLLHRALSPNGYENECNSSRKGLCTHPGPGPINLTNHRVIVESMAKSALANFEPLHSHVTFFNPKLRVLQKLKGRTGWNI
jgi:hypothetical protein